MNYSEAIALRHKIEHAAAQQTDADALQSIELFPKWMTDIDVAAGERRQFKAEGWDKAKLYKCVQPHHTSAEWTPDITPALWVEVSVEEWPEWRQPTGAQDAYNTGDKVSHNDKHWISDVDGNVWEPSIYGWTEAE